MTEKCGEEEGQLGYGVGVLMGRGWVKEEGSLKWGRISVSRETRRKETAQDFFLFFFIVFAFIIIQKIKMEKIFLKNKIERKKSLSHVLGPEAHLEFNSYGFL